MTPLARDRSIVAASLVIMAGLAWAWLVGLSRDMSTMGDMDMAMPASFALIATMWMVMMVGMMLPTAMPMILLFTTAQRRQRQRPLLSSGAFVAGYLVVWGGFAMAAAELQLELGRLAMLSPAMGLASTRIAGMVFLLAAAYELTPLKHRCLTQCSSPIGFIVSYWRPGITGALRMGAVHGAFCVGCCWALMLLLFVQGVMNLIWVAVLATLILVQKVLPNRRITALATAAAMAAAGIALLVSATA